MSYRLPDTFPALNRIVRKHGLQFSTERQAAFMLQQLAGTRLKFPPKGESCFQVLQRMEKALTGNVASDSSTVRTDRTVAATPKMSNMLDKSTFRSKRKVGKSRQRNRANLPLASAHREHSEISPSSFDTGLVIFCDGACEPNPGVGGWGFVVYRDGAEIHSEFGGDVRSTNNIMEMTGALMALRWFAARGIIEPVRLLCDSQYVVNGCNVWRHGWKAKGWKRGGPKADAKNAAIANLDLWKELDGALGLVPITLEWVKGHAGTVGNERADELAGMGRLDALAEEAPELVDGIPTALLQQLAMPA
jgi:ribonuclease HI